MTPEERKAKMDELKELQAKAQAMRDDLIARAEKAMREAGLSFEDALETLKNR